MLNGLRKISRKEIRETGKWGRHGTSENLQIA